MRPILVMLLGIVALIGAAEAETPSAANTDDAVISMRVKGALIANDDTKASQINVESQRGVVQLSGFVDSPGMRDTAERVARHVTGVIQVQNELLIRDPKRTLGSAVEDTVIAAKIKGELAGKAGFETATRVNVEVNSGVVALSGFVATASEKERASTIVRGVAGVKDVHNDIALKPQG